MKRTLAVAVAAATMVPGAGPLHSQGVQLGVRVTPDTVTVGQRFVAVIRVRAPRGSVIEFPGAQGSVNLPPMATQIVGEPAIQPVEDTVAVTTSAAYRLAAWDVGQQPLGIGNIAVIRDGDTSYVSLSGRTVFVRSVLPQEAELHVPRPPRPLIGIMPFDWLPLLIAALVIAALTALWRIWIWYSRRGDRPLDPYSAAQREFERIEAMNLIAAGESERHTALMSGVLRRYLTARVPGIERSHTSSEILAASVSIVDAAPGLGELLWLSDLVRFARHPVNADDAGRAGTAAKEMVASVEQLLAEREKIELEKAA